MTFKADGAPEKKQLLEAEELLALRKVLTKRIHPDGFTDPEDRKLAEATLAIVNVAYECIEKSLPWSKPFSNDYITSVGGKKRDGQVIKSGNSKLGEPINFLNKLFLFLNESVRKEAVQTTKTESATETSTNELLSKQNEFANQFLKTTLAELKTRNISINLSRFPVNERLDAFLSVVKVIYSLWIGVKKNQLPILFALDGERKISIDFIAKPLGTPDLMIINSSSGKRYEVNITFKDLDQTIQTIIKRINEQSL